MYFLFFFGEVVPFLLDADALSQTQFIISDQCPIMVPQINVALEKVLCDGKKVFGDGKHRLCKWHKVSDTILSYVHFHRNFFT